MPKIDTWDDEMLENVIDQIERYSQGLEDSKTTKSKVNKQNNKSRKLSEQELIHLFDQN